MSASARIHSPYVLATLPRPLDHTDGRILANPVYGIRKDNDGVKRQRKRKELVVGIDGEAVNIYDVSTSSLVTSYPVSPQESFVCAPCSARLRLFNRSVCRYTFAATRDANSCKITLFKDVVDAAGKTISTTAHCKLSSSVPLAHLDLSSPNTEQQLGQLVAVHADGSVSGLDVETLSTLWTESSKGLLFGSSGGSLRQCRVESVASTHTTKDGEWLSSWQPHRGPARNDGKVLALVFSASEDGSRKRYTLTLRADTSDSASTSGQRLTPLQAALLPEPEGRSDGDSKYMVEFSSGQLLEASGETLFVYDLSAVIPKLTRSIPFATQSFIPLSAQTVLSCSSAAIFIYDHMYRWTQAQAAFVKPEINGGMGVKTCTIVGYFRLLDIAVAVVGNSLVSIPIEPAQRGGKKRTFDGRLIDAIGRGESQRPLPSKSGESRSEDRLKKDVKEMARADGLLEEGNVVEFEKVLASKFGVNVSVTSPAEEPISQWDWYQPGLRYPVADRRWVRYAIRRALAADLSDQGSTVTLYPALSTDNVFTYLVLAGCLTLDNLRTGLRLSLDGAEAQDGDLSQEISRLIVNVDPTMQLLVSYISSTDLGPMGLLSAVKSLMYSLGLLQGTKRTTTTTTTTTKLLAAEPYDEAAEVDEMELDMLEEELAVAEHHLQDESDTRSHGLRLAFAKLGICPTATTVQALRATFKTDEILSLIYMLRVELAKGAWTARYVGLALFKEHGTDAPPDGAISLLSTLLSRCLDAIGPRAWFLNDDVTFGDHGESGEFLSTLKLEVKAALEGLEEAVYLNGIIGEAVRFASAFPATQAKTRPKQSRAALSSANPDIQQIHFQGRQAQMMPLSMPNAHAFETSKVGALGGEIKQRTKREIGHLKSQRVGAYSLERLVI